MFLGLLTLTLLPLACFGAKRSPGGRFEDWHAKLQSSAPLRLDDASYEELTATPRNHSLVVLLTALEARFGCQLCRDFQPEWELLSKSWAKGDRYGESRTLLGTLDFADGKTTFQKVLRLLMPPEEISGYVGCRSARLISSYSSCCKPLPYFSSSHQPQARTQNPMGNPFVTTSLLGMYLESLGFCVTALMIFTVQAAISRTSHVLDQSAIT